MLETVLRRGVRVQWMPPASRTGTNNGNVIATPTIPQNPLKYDGMDDQIHAGFHASTLGRRVGDAMQYRWLAYVSGQTTSMPLAGGDILTGPMSGCLIATWTDGTTKAAHIGTIDNNVSASRTVKRAFAAHAGASADLSAFNPAAQWTPGEVATAMGTRPMAFQIYGLITGRTNFYSVLMFELPANADQSNRIAGKAFQRVIGGIKPAPVITGVRLRAELMS